MNTILHFCHICNVRFHKALDFLLHRQEHVNKDHEIWEDKDHWEK